MNKAIEEYDFIELKVYDIHGFVKGRLASRSKMPDILKNGFGLGPMCFYGVKGQPNLHPAFWKDMGFANYRAIPLLSTLKPCQRAVSGDYKIASVVCEIRFRDGTLEIATPRELTRALLQRLESEFGLKIRSTFEAEFGIRDSKTDTPLAHVNKWSSITAVQIGQGVLMGLIHSLKEINVTIDTVMSEFGPGQFEVTFDITEGIEVADMLTEFKVGSYVYLKTKGYNAEFMTCAHPGVGCSNGFHLNFSLWDESGQNVFVDPDDPEKLSRLGCHWLAGMLEHAPAMTAICSPTINCYRRIGTVFAPIFVNWAPENREVTFRLKTEPGGNIFIENRLPSMACSPHLALACTLAAGMDGVRRKLSLPEPMDTSKRLPSTLEEALTALEADTSLKEALGSKFVELFIYTKRTFEIEEFKRFVNLSDEELLEKEKEYYYDPM